MRGQSLNKQFTVPRVKNYLALVFGVGVILSGLATGLLPQQAHATDTGYYGEYWNNPTGPGGDSPSFPNRVPDYTHTDPEINFNWGHGSPDGSIQNEDFVARWTKTTYLAAGTYHFDIGSDDGNRVYIDDHLVIDSWVDQGANPHQTADYDITAGQHTITVEFYENGAVAEIYFSYSNQTDSDGDGASNEVEAAGPNSGDANNDGTPDTEQGNVVSYINPVTGKYAALEVSDSCTIISSTIAGESANASADVGFDYPAGLMNFRLDCDTPGFTADVSQYYSELDASSYVGRKYNSTNKSYQVIPGVTISQVTIDGKNVAKVSYQVTDGGSLDEDGVANGTILDPSGVAATVVSAPNTGLGG